MDKIVVFYIRHEPDLVLLKNCPNFNLTKAFREAICAYVRNKEYSIDIPKMPNFAFPFKNVTCHLHFGDKKDADVIRFINTLRKSYGTCALKAIFRSYLNGFSASPYLEKYSSISKMGVGDSMIMVVNGKEEKKRIRPEKEEIKEETGQETEKIGTVEKEQHHKNIPKSESVTVIKEITPTKSKSEDLIPEGSEKISDDNSFDLFASIDKMVNYHRP